MKVFRFTRGEKNGRFLKILFLPKIAADEEQLGSLRVIKASKVDMIKVKMRVNFIVDCFVDSDHKGKNNGLELK